MPDTKPKAMEGAEIFIVVKNSGKEIVMEHFFRLINWMDDPDCERGRLVFRGMNEWDAAQPVFRVGETFWWTPVAPRAFIETTHLDDIAQHNVARARAIIPTLKPPQWGKGMIVVWEDTGVKISTVKN
jgi:hypothetical protein